MTTDSFDKVFRALAEPSRRRMLDLIKSNPGINVSELSEAFRFTRYAVMKHLRVLEDADLIVPRRVGKTKQLHLNAIPIQTIYDRWISKYSARWASQLTSFKYSLENQEETMTSQKPRHLYVLYIKTSVDRVWDALTNPALTKQYFHNTEVQSEFTLNSPIRYILTEKDGKRRDALTGTIEEVVPKQRLVHSFSFPSNDDAPSRVTWELEEMGDVTKLVCLHEFESEDSTFKGTGEGWPPILSGLKTLLETGKPLGVSFHS